MARLPLSLPPLRGSGDVANVARAELARAELARAEVDPPAGAVPGMVGARSGGAPLASSREVRGADFGLGLGARTTVPSSRKKENLTVAVRPSGHEADPRGGGGMQMARLTVIVPCCAAWSAIRKHALSRCRSIRLHASMIFSAFWRARNALRFQAVAWTPV